MKDKRKTQEHEDLEERFQLSADVQFETEGATYSGLQPIEFEIKKKKIPKKIENVRHRESKRGLF